MNHLKIGNGFSREKQDPGCEYQHMDRKFMEKLRLCSSFHDSDPEMHSKRNMVFHFPDLKMLFFQKGKIQCKKEFVRPACRTEVSF